MVVDTNWSVRGGAAALLIAGLGLGLSGTAIAQAPAAAAAPVVAPAPRGTVKAISGNQMTIATDAGQSYTITVPETAKLLQLPVGSTDLKTATTITLSDIGPGDRVLVSGKPGDTATAYLASRVILMKSGDIAQLRAAEQADWQKRGTGGLVTAVDPAAGVITVSVGAKKLLVDTTSKTVFKRYASDSVKFEDAKPGTIAQLEPGDQMRVRGAKSDDGLSLDAVEIVSGSFKNLAGTVATVDAAAGKLTLKDLATKKVMTIAVTAGSDVRSLPPQMAQMLAMRAKGGAPAGGGEGGGPPSGAGGGMARGDAGGGAPGGAGAGGARRGGGMDLAQMITRLPPATLADLKVGDAVMVVASEPSPGSPSVTAVTLLSGVEPLLAASPKGNPADTLSPWSMGGAPGGTE